MFCDLCNKTIDPNEAILIPNHEFHGAVDRGFNPFKISDLDLSSVRRINVNGLSDSELFAIWYRLVNTDSTDWHLCNKCANIYYRETIGKRQPEKGERAVTVGTIFPDTTQQNENFPMSRAERIEKELEEMRKTKDLSSFIESPRDTHYQLLQQGDRETRKQKSNSLVKKILNAFNFSQKRKDFNIFIEKSRICFEKGEFKQAINYIDSALALYPQDSYAIQLKDEYLSNKQKSVKKIKKMKIATEIIQSIKKPNDSYQEIKSNIESIPTDKQDIWNQALSAHRKGDYQSAIRLYDRYLEIKPQSAEALTNKASALCEIGLYDEAYKTVHLSFSINPGFPPTLNELGVIESDYFQNYDQALDWFDKGLKVCEVVPNETYKAILLLNKQKALGRKNK